MSEQYEVKFVAGNGYRIVTTDGSEVPFALQGGYTRPRLAQEALAKFLAGKQEQGE